MSDIRIKLAGQPIAQRWSRSQVCVDKFLTIVSCFVEGRVTLRTNVTTFRNCVIYGLNNTEMPFVICLFVREKAVDVNR